MVYKFLIYISYSYAIPIGEPLEKEIFSRGHKVFWFSDCENGQKALQNKSNTFVHIEEAVNYKPHIVLTINDVVPDFLTGLKVQIFHGFNAEKRTFKKGHFRIRGLFDLYCTQGPSTTQVFRKQQKSNPHFEIIETGWSKVDPLFPIEEIKPDTPPTIFISSTFTKRLSLAYKEDVFEKIKILSKTGKYNFIMVLHPKLPKDIVEKWKTLESENFSFFETTNLIPLFRKAAMMLSDTTSAIQEFGLQLKPIVTLDHYIPKPYLINITSVDEIEDAFQKALSQPKEILEKLATFNKRLHPYKDGRSSKRVIDASINFLHSDKSYLKRKPLNIVRKLKIRNQLHYYTFRSYNKPYTLSKPKEDIPSSPAITAITAIIPTLNEIDSIEEVIASVSFADEIFVIDSYSTDGTYEKAEKLADKVIQREFKYYADQKNWAISRAKHEWIILVDADERVTPDLKTEILEVLQNPSKNGEVAYWIGRKNHFMGEPVNYSGWKNDKVIRLFKRDFCEYEDKYVHEEIIAQGKVGVLKNKLHHNTYTTLDEYLEKMNHYAWFQARDYDKTTGRLTGFHFVLKPMWRFIKHYIIQGGFRDGVVGLTIAYIQAYTVFMRYAKLWLLRKNRK